MFAKSTLIASLFLNLLTDPHINLKHEHRIIIMTLRGNFIKLCYPFQVHSTESATNHNGGIGIDNDVYCGIGGRTTTDYFRSKTMPR